MRWIVQWLAGLLVPGAPTGFLLEGWPDAGGVIDDVRRRHAAVGAKFRNIDRIEGGLLPVGSCRSKRNQMVASDAPAVVVLCVTPRSVSCDWAVPANSAGAEIAREGPCSGERTTARWLNKRAPRSGQRRPGRGRDRADADHRVRLRGAPARPAVTSLPELTPPRRILPASTASMRTDTEPWILRGSLGELE